MAKTAVVKATPKRSTRQASAPWDRCCDTKAVVLAVIEGKGVGTHESVMNWIETSLKLPEAECPESVRNAYGDDSPKVYAEIVMVCLDYLVEVGVLFLTPAGVYKADPGKVKHLKPLLLTPEMAG
jgi:hypothetical protein